MKWPDKPDDGTKICMHIFLKKQAVAHWRLRGVPHGSAVGRKSVKVSGIQDSDHHLAGDDQQQRARN